MWWPRALAPECCRSPLRRSRTPLSPSLSSFSSRSFHGWKTWTTSSNPSWRPSASGWRICSSTRAAKSGEAPTGTSTKRGARTGKKRPRGGEREECGGGPGEPRLGAVGSAATELSSPAPFRGAVPAAGLNSRTRWVGAAGGLEGRAANCRESPWWAELRVTVGGANGRRSRSQETTKVECETDWSCRNLTPG